MLPLTEKYPCGKSSGTPRTTKYHTFEVLINIKNMPSWNPYQQNVKLENYSYPRQWKFPLKSLFTLNFFICW